MFDREYRVFPVEGALFDRPICHTSSSTYRGISAGIEGVEQVEVHNWGVPPVVPSHHLRVSVSSNPALFFSP
jgi:hypothetical protein